MGEESGEPSQRSHLDIGLEQGIGMIRLIAELCGIYAKDVSEKANVEAANALRRGFRAEATAIFYKNAKGEYQFCLAGADFPIALPEEEWRACVRTHSSAGKVARFGPWSPPGMDSSLPSWLSYRLYGTQTEDAFIFLGKVEGDWNEREETDLVDVIKAIAPIVNVRHEREVEEEERRAAEEKLANNERRLRTFLEGSRDMIYIADSADTVTWINAAGLALLGLEDGSEILGRPFVAFAFNPDDRRALLRKVRDMGFAADFEIVLKGKDGRSVFCLETTYAIRNPEGGVIELQGIVKDISERISSQSALWKTNIELADANLKLQKTQALMIQHEKLASIGLLAAGVAHEINNPLGFLKSNHEMLEKYVKTMRQAWEEARSSPQADFQGIERRRNLEYLFSQIDMIFLESYDGLARIMNIVGSLKNFSRADPNSDFAPYDLNAGIENTLAVARNEIKYVADVRKQLEELPLISAKGNEINQVILNIIVNAAQAIEGQKRKEKGVIEIRTMAIGEWVFLGIKDDGPGIPESIRTKIFDPFFTTKEPGKGTGLGLSISYDIIVTKHNGRLSVDSELGKGTTFIIELPIRRASAQDESELPPTPDS